MTSTESDFRYELEYAKPFKEPVSDTWMRSKIDMLPLYGVHFNEYLVTQGNASRYGDCTATVHSSARAQLEDILAATEPGMVNLWVWQGNQPIWGGIVWNRTYASQAGGTYQLYAQTFDSYAENFIFTTNRTWTDDCTNIIKIVWDEIQIPVEWNIALEVHQPPLPVVQSVTKNVVGDEYVIASDVVSEMIELGAEYRLIYFKDIYGRPRARFNTGRWDGLGPKVGIPYGPASPDLNYPGDISNYWISESGSKGGTHFYGIGKGTGATTPRAVRINAQSIAAGRPAISKKLNFRDSESQTNLELRMDRAVLENQLPIVTPSFKLQDTSSKGTGLQFQTTNRDLFKSFALGDYLLVTLDDKNRFSTPYKAFYRCISKGFSPDTGQFDIGIDQFGG